jgi:hypothetical protein
MAHGRLAHHGRSACAQELAVSGGALGDALLVCALCGGIVDQRDPRTMWRDLSGRGPEECSRLLSLKYDEGGGTA